MMGFDYATSTSFLALLVNQIKTDILKFFKILQNLKEQLPHFAVKMFKNIFVFGAMSSKPSNT